MKSWFSHLTSLLILFFAVAFVQQTYAAVDGATDAGIYIWATSSTYDIRNGNFTMDSIPQLITGIIEILLGIAGTISIVALIYHAVQMQLASGITGDSTWVDKAKAGMKWSLLGFALALSAWFLITKFVELLSSAT